MTQHEKNAYILFYRKSSSPVSKSQIFSPAQLGEVNPSMIVGNDNFQKDETQNIAASKLSMSDVQFNKALQIERAKTIYSSAYSRTTTNAQPVLLD